jgi:hypothetical protein
MTLQPVGAAFVEMSRPEFQWSVLLLRGRNGATNFHCRGLCERSPRSETATDVQNAPVFDHVISWVMAEGFT